MSFSRTAGLPQELFNVVLKCNLNLGTIDSRTGFP